MKMSNKSNRTRLKNEYNKNLIAKRKPSNKKSKISNGTTKIKLKTWKMKTKRPLMKPKNKLKSRLTWSGNKRSNNLRPMFKQLLMTRMQ